MARRRWELPLGNVHLTRTDRKGGRSEAGLVQHRGLLLSTDIVEMDGRNVTSPTRTALDLTTILDVEHSLPVFDHFLHAGATTKSQLRGGAAPCVFGRTRSHRPRHRAFRTLLRVRR